jgi:NADPH-dependent curcumin reductase CurA
MLNKSIHLIKRPEGLPQEEDFQLRENPVPELEDGQILVRQLYISLDPAMRGWMNEGKSYLPPVGLGDVMRAGSLGQIVASKNDKYQEGQWLSGAGGVQQYCITDAKGWYPVPYGMAPLPVFLSTLGMPGMTAYFGLLEVGKPVEGDTVLVSGAAGAVGSVVGQIAKIKGCRVVGIAGSDDKCNYVTEELGFDHCINYKTDDIRQALKEHCPDGINVYFDNVGGETLDMALAKLAMHARVVICGAISQYNQMQSIEGPKNYLSLLVHRAKMEGFVVMDYAKRYTEAAMEMGQWMMQGKLKSKEHIENGIEHFPSVLHRLFSGEKLGKLILQVNDEE